MKTIKRNVTNTFRNVKKGELITGFENKKLRTRKSSERVQIVPKSKKSKVKVFTQEEINRINEELKNK